MNLTKNAVAVVLIHRRAGICGGVVLEEDGMALLGDGVGLSGGIIDAPVAAAPAEAEQAGEYPKHFPGGHAAHRQAGACGAGILDHHGQDVRICGAGLCPEKGKAVQLLCPGQLLRCPETGIQPVKPVIAVFPHGANIAVLPGGDARGQRLYGAGFQLRNHHPEILCREEGIGAGVLPGYKVQNPGIFSVPEPGVGVRQPGAEPVLHGVTFRAVGVSILGHGDQSSF